ncbi:MAG: hypothetical protein E7376_01410 [Clostridiales bacterium]|nr:hypothetical protein [Clostridiales bacterium]
MKGKLFKKILGGFLVCSLALCGLLCVNSPKVALAENSVDVINYVSLGDSIAEGYGLNAFTGAGQNVFVDGCYTNSFKNYISEKTGVTANALSYAKSGDESSHLLSLLNDSNVQASLAGADIITICIGGNDLLGIAKNGVVDILVDNFINSLIGGTQKDLSTLETSLAAAVSSFSTNLDAISTKLKQYAPNAKIIFTNIYNPYKTFSSCNSDIALTVTSTGLPPYTLSKSIINQFGNLTEDYLAGNSQKGVAGINQVIAQKVASTENFYMVDSKTEFDNYSGDYTEITCATLAQYQALSLDIELEVDLSILSDPVKLEETKAKLKSDVVVALGPYIDPHPTAAGHEILYNTHKTYFEDTLAFVTFDYNGGALQGKTDSKIVTDLNKTLSALSQNPEKGQEYNFAGWCSDSACENEYDFSQNIQSNTTIYAKWEYVTFTVTFNYNGGLVGQESSHEQQVIINRTATVPGTDKTPTLSKHAFLGWYEDLNSDTPYDFNTTITNNKTLYAKWERNVFNVTFHFNGGTIGEQTEIVVEVNKGNVIADIPQPEKEDYEIVGWYTDLSFTTEWNFATDRITEDVDLYANWIRNVLYVTFDYNGGKLNGVSSYLLKVQEGQPIDLTKVATPSKTNYLFIYWYLTDETQEFNFNTTITQDITLYAYWKEAIVINVHDGQNTRPYSIVKGSTIADLPKYVPMTKQGTAFYGWFEDISRYNEFANDYVLVAGRTVYMKWVTLKCLDETLLEQAFSPIVEKVVWHIDARDGSELEWLVNGETYFTDTVIGDAGARCNFIPSAVGSFTITCKVNGVVVNGKTVEITFSTPKDVQIILNKVAGKRTYYLQVDNSQYYDEAKFVWYKTSDIFSDDFTEQIGTGFECVYKFSSDCKVVAKYMEYEDAQDGIMSNVISIEVDRYLDDVTLYAILGGVAVVALIVVTIISRRRFKSFF